MKAIITRPPSEGIDAVGALQARNQFGALLDKAYYQDAEFIIERTGKPMAVLLPMSVYRWMLEVKKRNINDFFAQAETLQKAFSGMSEDQIEALVQEAIQAARAEIKQP